MLQLTLSNSAKEAMEMLNQEEQEFARGEVYKVTRPSTTKEV